jgi:CBS domain containing-hemolysin-like protein
MAQICSANHSRLPVHNGSMDVIQGMIHIKDLMPHLLTGSNPDLKELMRPVLFVSPSIWVMDLLHEMRLKRRHLALVVDEFGGVDGLITIEDLVEEIVGEIEDEHDEMEMPRFELIDDDSAISDARLELEDLEKLVGPLVDDAEREEIDTVAGLVFSLAGRVPVRGEVIRHPCGLEFEVLEGDPRRITLLKIDGIHSVKTQENKHS